MNQKREIMFTTTESKTKLTEGAVWYQGQLIHNNTQGMRETRANFAQYCSLHESLTNYFLDSLGEFIRKELAQGYRLNFGPFAVGLGLRGGFPAANAPFDEKRNTLAVELIPSAEIKKLTHELKPVNVTQNCTAVIYNTMQVEPELKEYDVFDCCGNRILSASGIGMGVHAGAVGEGAWIENDVGEQVLVGEIMESDNTICRFRVTEPIAPGNYWVVICSRHARTGKFVKSRRRICAR